MKLTSKLLSSASGVTVFLALGTVSGFAQGQHPAYLHALTDLRHARANLERDHEGHSGPLPPIRTSAPEKAIHEIDEAIDAIRKASIDDGKNLNDHPPVDAKLDWRGRLHRALELINKAHNDVAGEEDNGFAQGLQRRAIDHIDKAHRHIEEAIQIAEGNR